MKIVTNYKIKETIKLPKQGIHNLFEAISIFESAQDEIEDFLIIRNKSIMNKIEKARKNHLGGKVKDFQELVKKYV